MGEWGEIGFQLVATKLLTCSCLVHYPPSPYHHHHCYQIMIKSDMDCSPCARPPLFADHGELQHHPRRRRHRFLRLLRSQAFPYGAKVRLSWYQSGRQFFDGLEQASQSWWAVECKVLCMATPPPPPHIHHVVSLLGFHCHLMVKHYLTQSVRTLKLSQWLLTDWLVHWLIDWLTGWLPFSISWSLLVP